MAGIESSQSTARSYPGSFAALYYEYDDTRMLLIYVMLRAYRDVVSGQ